MDSIGGNITFWIYSDQKGLVLPTYYAFSHLKEACWSESCYYYYLPFDSLMTGKEVTRYVLNPIHGGEKNE